MPVSADQFKLGEKAIESDIFNPGHACGGQHSPASARTAKYQMTGPQHNHVGGSRRNCVTADEGCGSHGCGNRDLHDGKVAFSKAYGFRDKDQNLPLTVASVVSALHAQNHDLGGLDESGRSLTGFELHFSGRPGSYD